MLHVSQHPTTSGLPEPKPPYTAYRNSVAKVSLGNESIRVPIGEGEKFYAVEACGRFIILDGDLQVNSQDRNVVIDNQLGLAFNKLSNWLLEQPNIMQCSNCEEKSVSNVFYSNCIVDDGCIVSSIVLSCSHCIEQCANYVGKLKSLGSVVNSDGSLVDPEPTVTIYKPDGSTYTTKRMFIREGFLGAEPPPNIGFPPNTILEVSDQIGNESMYLPNGMDIPPLFFINLKGYNNRMAKSLICQHTYPKQFKMWLACKKYIWFLGPYMYGCNDVKPVEVALNRSKQPQSFVEYQVVTDQARVRETPHLSSPEVCEPILKGDLVYVNIHMAWVDNEGNQRVLVRLNDNTIGWMTKQSKSKNLVILKKSDFQVLADLQDTEPARWHTCPVCLQDIQGPDDCGVLATCNHAYCLGCVNNIYQLGNCAVCRQEQKQPWLFYKDIDQSTVYFSDDS